MLLAVFSRLDERMVLSTLLPSSLAGGHSPSPSNFFSVAYLFLPPGRFLSAVFNMQNRFLFPVVSLSIGAIGRGASFRVFSGFPPPPTPGLAEISLPFLAFSFLALAIRSSANPATSRTQSRRICSLQYCVLFPDSYPLSSADFTLG